MAGDRRRRCSSSACSGGRGSATRGSPAWSTRRRASSGITMFVADGRRCSSRRCACPRRSATSACCSRCVYAVVRIAQIGAVRHRQPRRAGAAPVGPRAGHQHGARHGDPRRRVVRRRLAAGRAVGAGARARHGRAGVVRRRGLEALARALRRAPRADHHHRARRVDRGHRHRRGARGRRVGGGRGHARRRRRRRRSGGSTSTSSRSSRRGGWSRPTPGREQNEIARDSFSFLHFPMVAGIVLVALGLKKTLQHTDERAEARGRDRAARRRRALPARARGLPLAQRAPLQLAAARPRPWSASR